ncbi:MAG: hypothetical protein M1828_007155 [Chrysothrix sp. TS-e1954]|nr:MAG: hypothetical protein M1828_007155 [Chrysothrix sp. TS-e1954]
MANQAVASSVNVIQSSDQQKWMVNKANRSHDRVKEEVKTTSDDEDATDAEDGDEEEEEVEDVERLKHSVLPRARQAVAQVLGSDAILHTMVHVARGEYNHVWLVESVGSKDCDRPMRFVLRTPRDTPNLHPYQVRHEVACLRYLNENLPRIPVPKLFAWHDGVPDPGAAFIAQEFIDGQRLATAWPNLPEEGKATVIQEIAHVIADLGETRFNAIGGLSLDLEAGPTIEAGKEFNGRNKIHSPLCYDIGPYANSKHYIRSCYDREIYYWTFAEEIDTHAHDWFPNTSIPEFVDLLKQEKHDVLNNNNVFASIDTEPLVLCHEDFHAGNMLVRDGHLVGVIDWEFSGTYPLSELVPGPMKVLQISGESRHESTKIEEDKWHEQYRRDVERVVRQRGWKDVDIAILMGDGHEVLHRARHIMQPVVDEVEVQTEP